MEMVSRRMQAPHLAALALASAALAAGAAEARAGQFHVYGCRTPAGQPAPSLFEIMEQIERRVILDMLEQTGWNQTEAAERFMIPLSTLNQKIKRLGIDVRRRGRADETFTAVTGK